MRKAKRIISIFVAVCMVFAMTAVVFAKETAASSMSPDYNQRGSIVVEILSTDTKKAIPGGKMTLYKVAAAVPADGDNIFHLTEDFAGSGVNLDRISESDAGAKELASVLETYVNHQKRAGEAVTVDDNGRAEWKDLELGLYLIVNTAAAEGYAPINSFLITVPRYLNESYVYDVTANPKAETANEAAANPPKQNTTTTISGGKLPQTGQLWWPVPILAIAGMLFLMFGWYRRRRLGENKNVYE